MEIQDTILNAKEVSKILNVSLPLVYLMADRGQLPCVRWQSPSKGKPKTMVRFKQSDIWAFIEGNYRKSSA